jgi:hypothetical protein
LRDRRLADCLWLGPVVRQLLSHLDAPTVIEMSSCLAVDPSCTTACVLAPVVPGVLQQSPVGDPTIQLAESFGRIGRCKVAKMFKFAEWVAPEV